MALRAVLGAGALALLRPACGLELARSAQEGLPWYELHPGWGLDDWKKELNLSDPPKVAFRKATTDERKAHDEAKRQCSIAGIASRRGSSRAMENGTIAYLVTRRSDLAQLSESLPRLRHHFLRFWPYPVKIFVVSDSLRQYDNDTFDNLTCKKDTYHHSDGTVGWGRISCTPDNAPNKEEVRKVASESLGPDYDWEVAEFDLRVPEAVKVRPEWENCDRKHMGCGPRWENMNLCAAWPGIKPGYMHMNQFFTKVMYEQEALRKYKYYLRLDADFEFRETLKADPFCTMAQTGRKFIWQTRRHSGSPFCTQGLWEWFQKYQQDNGLTPQDPHFWRESSAMVNYVGYAGMGDLDFFRSEPVRKLAEAFNNDGRVYLNRWSDQTYYVLLFALFENHSAVGDIGFEWPDASWCHKCQHHGKFDPITGKTS
ncbi:unnamed protein product [Prorocentrum cordatum]|uniref:Protein xylosyltransferase n=2 Tax=Prorocentrum cordatum TaxID=2364126 RepID=A0ABN9R7M2_9DINO|nr:unnamed protein product [Polarella glacialis]